MLPAQIATVGTTHYTTGRSHLQANSRTLNASSYVDFVERVRTVLRTVGTRAAWKNVSSVWYTRGIDARPRLEVPQMSLDAHQQRPDELYLLRALLSGVVPCLVLFAQLAHGGAPDEELAKQVRALLSDRCFACHGPDGTSREAGLRLDTQEGFQAVAALADDRKVVVPGDVAASELWTRVTSDDRHHLMPPPESNRSLSSDDLKLLQQWIEAGAPWTDHWAFVSPGRPELPPDDVWCTNQIDRFALQRMRSDGLDPSARAPREELIRRVTLDLTGLPPTLEEVDAFLADDSPAAFERVVDRLLASPRFGERMASDWLDLARYADTYGYQADRFRRVWPYRDWVIKAFNDNLPYDQFLTWQLAGDLLPDATQEQILATAFNRLHRQTNEGGSIPLEFRTAGVCDRTNTFGAAVLGLTFECARCHDHKFDPLSTRDYYQFYAFFNSIDELGLYSHFTDSCPTPTLWLDSQEQREQLRDLEQQIAELEQTCNRLATESLEEFQAWRATADLKEVTQPRPTYHARLDGDEPAVKRSGSPRSVPGREGNGLLLDGENGFATTDTFAFDRHDAFSIGIWLKPGEELPRAVILHRSAAWLDAAGRGYQIMLEAGRPEVALVHFWPGNALAIRAASPLPIGEWSHVAFTYDGSCQSAGLRLFINGRQIETETMADCLDRSLRYIPGDLQGDGLKVAVGNRFRDNGFRSGSVDELTIFDHELSTAEVARLAKADPNHADEALLPIYLREHAAPYQHAVEQLRALRQQRSKLIDSIPEIMAMRDLEQRRPAFVLRRGAYDAPGDPVEPNTPAAIGNDIPLERPDRLGLARWSTDPRNPLTARVAVNRLWYLMFGRGIVHPIDNFGSQGAAPTHPELLDWLAVEFVESGWDTKALIKQMVMSSTYRQTAVANTDLRNHDADNLLLARGPNHRLSAEMLRDAALSTSGLLVDQIGGPPVKPYQPPGLWQEKGGGKYNRDAGPGSHRRSLYTYWKLTSPPPAMMTFDAADREICVVQRQSTSTPLQALVLLNDPQFVEAAVGVSDRGWNLDAESLDDRLAYVFRLLLSRAPSTSEATVLRQLYDDQLARFDDAPDEAKGLLETGDFRPTCGEKDEHVAALAMVALAVMSHHGFVTN